MTEEPWAIVERLRDGECIVMAENQLAMNFIELEEWDLADTHLTAANRQVESMSLVYRARRVGWLMYNPARIVRGRGHHEEALNLLRATLERAEAVRSQTLTDCFASRSGASASLSTGTPSMRPDVSTPTVERLVAADRTRLDALRQSAPRRRHDYTVVDAPRPLEYADLRAML